MSAKNTWVLFRLKSQPFAVATESVREMVALKSDSIVSVPKAAAYIRGVMSVRKEVMPLVDLRLRLGLPSLAEECRVALETAAAREQDHKNWIAELEACARDNRAFTKATDPNQCAFGKWYNALKVNNHILADVLQKFDAPHKLIHASALEVISYLKDKRREDALAVVERVKNGPFRQMMALFQEFGSTMAESFREIAIVLEATNQVYAVTADAVESVEEIALEDLPLNAEGGQNGLVEKVGRRKDNELVMVLSPEYLSPGIGDVTLESTAPLLVSSSIGAS